MASCSSPNDAIRLKTENAVQFYLRKMWTGGVTVFKRRRLHRPYTSEVGDEVLSKCCLRKKSLACQYHSVEHSQQCNRNQRQPIQTPSVLYDI